MIFGIVRFHKFLEFVEIVLRFPERSETVKTINLRLLHFNSINFQQTTTLFANFIQHVQVFIIGP